jgi:tetratricopeptide (TPR) repeat protein
VHPSIITASDSHAVQGRHGSGHTRLLLEPGHGPVFREEEAAALLLPVLDRPEAQADTELFAAAVVIAGTVASRAHLARALRLGEQALKLARQLDDARLLIDALATLGYVCYLASKPERGLPFGQEAVQRARQLGDEVLLGLSLMDYLLCATLINPAHAKPLITGASACTQRSGDQLFANFVNNNPGVHALRAGDIDAARAYLQQAVQAMRAIGGEFIDLPINTGWVLHLGDDADGA